MKAWARSDEAKSYQKHVQSFIVEFAPNGSFRAEEVPPGKYELDVMLTASDKPVQTPSDYLGLFHQEVVVPDPPNSQDDSPADLGTLEGEVKPLPAVGSHQGHI